MADYLFEASDAAGNIERGIIEATDVISAIEQLVRRNLSVQSIALQDEVTARAEKQRLILQRNLSELTARRSDWIAAIDALCDELPGGVTRLELQNLSKQLGSSRFDQPALTLLEDPSTAPLLPLLAERDKTPVTESCLREWLSETLKQREQRVQQRKRWIYPAALMGISLTLMIAFAFLLVPIFREMYSEFGLVLSPPTLFTFWFASQISTYLLRTLMILMLIFVLLLPLVHLWRSRSLSNRMFGSLLAGTAFNLQSMSLLTNSLADMLSLGVPLSLAISLAGKASRSFVFEQAAVELSAQIGQSTVIDPACSSRTLPPSLLFALRAQPNGLPSIPLLRAIAQTYSDRAKNRVDWLTSMLPIFAIVAIGCGVGFVVISLFMPLVSLVTSLA